MSRSFSPVLAAPQETLRGAFLSLTDPRELAALLEVDYSTLTFWLYRAEAEKRYETFCVPKRRGGHREISSPRGSLKILQSKLNVILSTVYKPKSSVQAFIPDGSVVKNARRHLGQRLLFTIDLRNFFPSIHFGRVRGMFIGKPYNLPSSVATVLGALACNEHGRLPQGGPSSPIISNMICAKMDSQFVRLTRKFGVVYTRYADDLTFSTTRTAFPGAIVDPDNHGPGDGVRAIISENGFEINEEKVRLATPHTRKEVTGIVVNSRLNVKRRLISEVRGMLHALETWGPEKAEAQHIQKYRKHRRSGSKPPFLDVLRGKINYIGMVRGKDDPLYIRLRKRLAACDPNDRWKDSHSFEGKIENAVWVVESDYGDGDEPAADDYIQGSGFLLRSVGFVTCHHVTRRRMRAHPWDRPVDQQTLRLRTWDDDLDIAIMEPPRAELVALDYDLDFEVRQGTPIRVVGFPDYNLGDRVFIERGEVSQVRQRLGRFIVTASIVKGNSGGPVLNMDDKVIGVAVTGRETFRESGSSVSSAPYGVVPIRRVIELLSRPEG